MKCFVLVTARLKSTRLPYKVLKPLAGHPMMRHLLERMKRVRGIDGLMICTSGLAQDDPLEELACKEGVGCFRGHPDDVLTRLRDAAENCGADQILSCTADNPLTDPDYAEKLLGAHLKEGNDFSRLTGLPIGTACSAMSAAALKMACEIKDLEDTEVWGDYFLGTGLFRVGEVKANQCHQADSRFRLTVDTPEDFSLMEAIFRELYTRNNAFGLDEVLSLLARRPDIAEINAHIQQKPGLPIKLKLTR